MVRHLRNNRAFTLLEVIVSLMLVSLIGTLGSMGIISYTKSFLLARDAADNAGHGQLALLRLSKEFVALKSVTAATSSSITFMSNHSDGAHTFTISVSSGNLVLSEGGSSNILTNGVSSFSLEYYEWDYTNDNLIKTISTTDTDGPGFWVDEVPCCTPIQLYIDSAECKDSNKLKIKATDTASGGLTQTLNITYDGNDTGLCKHGTQHYDASTIAPSTSGPPPSCTSNPRAIPGQDWYDTAYIWPAGNPECYLEIPISNDDCTAGSNSNPPPAGLVSGTQIIQATLFMNNVSQPFVIRVSPRNTHSYIMDTVCP